MTDMIMLGVRVPYDAQPKIKKAARERGMSVSAWFRQIALDAVGYEPPSLRVRMEGIRNEPPKVVSLADAVADLHRRGYGAQGIAAQTRAPYRQICEILAEIKSAKETA